ncbi:Zinc finger protein 165 [Mizuhopecten yessoensis]|uniref:Zinc finger protein 165 n=2 Tax=Mizuhopecten yessoensis TaxID=6573 RepID=A0A210Q3I0_MIZYE|nr:Zinc finger protein 165 [Mizuhopecten yessoensis]
MDLGTYVDNFYENNSTASLMTQAAGFQPQFIQGHGNARSLEGQNDTLSRIQDDIPCGLCLMNCPSKEEFRDHVLSFHGDQYTHLCYECGKLFKSYQGYKKHEKLFHRGGVDCKSCEICGRQCPDESSLKKHRMMHTGDRPFSCDKCGRTYKHRSNLKDHSCVGLQV